MKATSVRIVITTDGTKIHDKYNRTQISECLYICFTDIQQVLSFSENNRLYLWPAQ